MSYVVVPRRRGLVFLLLGSLVGALCGLLGTTAATASSPTAPVTMVITGVTGAQAPAGTPSGSVPFALVKAGDPFTVEVAFFDSANNQASFNNDTTLKVTSTAGTLTPSTGVANAGATTAQITTSLATPANQVGLTVTVPSGPAKGLTTGPPAAGQRFDVLSQLRFEPSSTNFAQGIGGDGNCTNATRAAPVCGIVMLPRGAGSQVLLSLGVCDPDPLSLYAPCFVGPKGPGGAVVQTLFGQPTDAYTPTSPVTVVIKCDKTLCGTGSIQDLKLAFSQLGNGALADAQPCPAKGVTDANGDPCVDYVQSKRDGSGDTHLYFLTPVDMRIGIG
jgi:hypothetical protein